jgi:hypothetical protein
MNEQVKVTKGRTSQFGWHQNAEIIASQPQFGHAPPLPRAKFATVPPRPAPIASDRIAVPRVGDVGGGVEECHALAKLSEDRLAVFRYCPVITVGVMPVLHLCFTEGMALIGRADDPPAGGKFDTVGGGCIAMACLG